MRRATEENNFQQQLAEMTNILSERYGFPKDSIQSQFYPCPVSDSNEFRFSTKILGRWFYTVVRIDGYRIHGIRNQMDTQYIHEYISQAIKQLRDEIISQCSIQDLTERNLAQFADLITQKPDYNYRINYEPLEVFKSNDTCENKITKNPAEVKYETILGKLREYHQWCKEEDLMDQQDEFESLFGDELN